MIESVSRRAFSGSSGTYHVHASELAAARERKLRGLTTTVVFLDDTEHCFRLDKRAKGSVLLDLVYQHLELVEKDYFGLQYSENNVTRWLDPSKSVKKQLGNSQYPLYFRVKFYVSDPSKLQEEYTRYQFYLQVRRDILHGKLQLPPSTACLLASYTVQSEVGDYHPDEHGPNYLSNLQLVPGQTEEMEKKISELHKLHKGQLPADAEFNFLDHAKRCDMYGVELHKARDNTNKDIQLGVTSIGLVVFQNTIRINTFSWAKITKISFKRKQFFIQLKREPSETYDTLLGFNMETYRSSKSLWKACVEHHTFFRLHSPKLRRRFPLSLGSKFHYSGRTEYQTVTEVRQQRGKLERVFVRSPSKHLARRSVPPPPLLPIEDKAAVGVLKALAVPPGRPPRPSGDKVTVLGAKEPRKAWADDGALPSDDDGGFLERVVTESTAAPFSPGLAGRVLTYADDPEPTSPTLATSPVGGGGGSGNGLYDTPPYSASQSPVSQLAAAGSDGSASGGGSGTDNNGLVTVRLQPDEDGRYGFNVKGGATADMPIVVSRVAPNTPADRCIPRLTEGDQVLFINGQDVSHAIHETVVRLIREARDTRTGQLTLVIKPCALYTGVEEEEPPYQYVPVGGNGIANTAVGDALAQSMLLLADGLASGALVAQYEQLYRKHPEMSCEESKKPDNVYKNRYRDISPYDQTRVVLRNPPASTSTPPSPPTDYINANYVNMPCCTTNGSPPPATTSTEPIQINRYIATQGPLQTTTDDFWQMVWEQDSNLVVMLTTVVERGRAKCHKYWPSVGETLSTSSGLEIRCAGEETDDSGSFVFRDFVMRDARPAPATEGDGEDSDGGGGSDAGSGGGEEREVTHMQYVAWPDHGVPDSPGLFLRFTERVREARQTSPTAGPVVVHCSAGIGRTGVLVLMETAMCLIEAGEPVYPLDIVQTMREQRAMMIQNASQYRFVCESVHTAYSEGIVKPPHSQTQFPAR